MALQEIRRYEDDFRVWHSAYTNMGFLAHWHEEIELIRVRSGAAEITVDNQTYFVHKGDVLICSSGHIHYCDSFHLSNTLEFVLFDPALLQSGRSPLCVCSCCITEQQLREAGLSGTAARLFDGLSAELLGKAPHYQEVAKGMLRVFWYQLQRLLPDENEMSALQTLEDGHPIHRVIRYMEQHVSEELSLEQLAHRFGISNCYLSRCFKRYTGKNFVMYRNLLRVEQAIALLQNTTRSVSEIAFNCGFQDIRTCNRVFRQYTEHSPLDFRRDLSLGVHVMAYPHRRSDEGLLVENDSPVVRQHDGGRQ
ncbi:MAG: AraC family transcriptional regulator [Clostridia bacterium]|nr:AraC family transcriptional regulator [Clostridia bacterium]